MTAVEGEIYYMPIIQYNSDCYTAYLHPKTKINIIYINFHLQAISIKIIRFPPKARPFTDILQNQLRPLFSPDIYFVKLLDFCYKI